MEHWFGVTVRFDCFACRRHSVERMALSASKSNDRESIDKAINYQKLSCQLCRTPVADGVQVHVHVKPYALKRLRQLGYPVPSDK